MPNKVKRTELKILFSRKSCAFYETPISKSLVNTCSSSKQLGFYIKKNYIFVILGCRGTGCGGGCSS